MKTARLLGPRTILVVDADCPPLGRDEVLVKVLACGVCGSDLHAWRGVTGVQYPLPDGAPGHEVWGEIAEIGPLSRPYPLRVGQPVTGLVQRGFAQYALARVEELLAVPANFGGAIVLGEPLACATNIARRASPDPGAGVAVVGFGYIAALVVHLLFAGRRGGWVAISRRPESRELARRLGAEAAYGFDEVPDELRDRFPTVIEAAGVQQALDVATWLTGYGGRLIIAGYHADGPRTVNVQSWNWKGIDVINAHERRTEAYLRGLRKGLRIVNEGGLALEALITHRWPLSHVGDALRVAEQRPAGYVKGVVQPWSE